MDDGAGAFFVGVFFGIMTIIVVLLFRILGSV